MSTKVFKYGARNPRCELLREQMHLGHTYYNALVEAENNRRKALWGGDAPPAPPHDHKDEDPCAECKEHWKALRKRLREAPLLDVKPLRGEFSKKGLYWGTYLLIEQAFAAAWKTTDSLHTVKFRSWRAGAVAGVQIQRRVYERNLGKDLLQISRVLDPRKGRRARDGRGRAVIKIRIGTKDGKPVFAGIPVELHRPMSGRPTWAKVTVKYIADREIWEVHVTCTEVEAQEGAESGVVAIDCSWRKMEDGGWRIGFARDDRGELSELRLSPRWAELTARADRIRSHRDLRLVELQKTDSRFTKQRSPQGVARAVRRLQDAGEDPGILIIEWLKRDRHLWQYEVGCRRRSVAARRDAMRKWVRSLRDRYKRVIVKSTRHKQLKEKRDLPRPARRQGQHAAPGELIECLRQVFGDENMFVVKAKDTTATCRACGTVNDHGAELMIRCEKCGDERDRDEASTANMMELWINGEAEAPKARKATPRFAKRHKSASPAA